MVTACACLAVGACQTSRPADWNERAVRAADLHSDREFGRAEQMYRSLLSEVPEGSRDARYVHSKLAELSADQGNYKRALEHYRRAWRGQRDEIAARARFDAGIVHDRHLNRPEEAESHWFGVIQSYPNTANAEKAIERLARRFAKNGMPEEFARRAHEILSQIDGSLSADNLMFWVARGYELAEPPARHRSKAVRWYRRLLREYPDASMADDAHWELAQIYVDRQRWDRAFTQYEQLAEMYRPSWLVGSYSSPYASRSRYRLGFLRLLYTDDYEEAARQFKTYLETFPTLRYADESAWHLAHIARLQGNDSRYRQRLKQFLEDFPESRYVERARRLLESSTSKRTSQSQ